MRKVRMPAEETSISLETMLDLGEISFLTSDRIFYNSLSDYHLFAAMLILWPWAQTHWEKSLLMLPRSSITCISLCLTRQVAL